jgi:Holliday junction resolvase-like predicted endonuclease
LELDIIATKNNIIYIFEVKSSYLGNGDSPLMRINQQKVNHLYRAAMGYMIARGMTQEFEVLGLSVCVNLMQRKAKIEVVTCGFY